MRVVQYSPLVQVVKVVVCVFLCASTCTKGKSGWISLSIHAIGTSGEWVIVLCDNLGYHIELNSISLASAIGEYASH